MYQPRPSPRDRAATLALVVTIHVALGFALINLSGNVREVLPQDVVEMFDVTVPPPPPPPVVEKLTEPEPSKPKKDEGAASARNIKSKATPVVAPRPIQLPISQPMPATTTPSTGSDSTQGASTPGPGTGAGGQGVGTGSGGAGNGSGGGGSGGIATPSRILRKLGPRDFPPGVINGTPRGGRIFTRLRIEADGRVSQCDIMRSFGNRDAEGWTCALLRQKATFQPAIDRAGRPVSSWFGYIQEF